MTTTKFGYHTKDYCIQVHRWAKRLDATECIIHKNGAVSLFCNDDCICDNYYPSHKELRG